MVTKKSNTKSPRKAPTKRPPPPEASVFVPVAHPFYSRPSVGKAALRVRSARWEESGGLYAGSYAISAAAPLEPHYFPTRFQIVRLNSAERKALSTSAGYQWSEEEFQVLRRSIERTILSVSFEYLKPQTRSLLAKLRAIADACDMLNFQIRSVGEPLLHSAILQDSDVVENFLSNNFNLDELTSGLAILKFLCDEEIEKLEPIVSSRGKRADRTFNAMLADIVLISNQAEISSALPNNVTTASATPLSALALEVSRLVAEKGLAYLKGPGGSLFSEQRSTLESKLRAYANRSNLAIAKALKKVRSELAADSQSSAIMGFSMDEKTFRHLQSGRDPDDPRPPRRPKRGWWAP